MGPVRRLALAVVALLASAVAGAVLRGGAAPAPAPHRCAAVQATREDGGAALHLRLRCRGRLHEWRLERVVALYEKPEQAGAHGSTTFKSVRPGEGWVVAQLAADGAVHGVWYDAKDGIVQEFSSASRVVALGTSFRGLSPESLSLSGCAQAPAIPDLASAAQAAVLAGAVALKQEQEHQQQQHQQQQKQQQQDHQHASAQTPSVAADPLVFWGRGTCFPGDVNTHTLSVGLLLHNSFVQFYGSLAAARAAMEAAFVTSSIVYEYQFNVALQIGEMMDATSAPSAVAELLTGCPGSSVVDALGAMSPVVAGLTEKQGVWTLLTNCYPASKTGTGILGVANMGACGCGFQARGWNIGVVNTSPALWRTLAHELGHGLGMKHSFENGKGMTGGIMDYGNPLVDGVPRFRTERAPEACATLAAMKATRCGLLVDLQRRLAPRPTLPFPSARPTRLRPPSSPSSSAPSSLAPSALPAGGGTSSGTSSGTGRAPAQPGPGLPTVILAAGLSAIMLVNVAAAAVRFSRRDKDCDSNSFRTDRTTRGHAALALAPGGGPGRSQ
jgi:hypothetical protein